MTKKREVITFKVDKALHEVIKDIPNRSEFIRSAIVNALGGTCPLCSGTGMLSADQKRHWDEFTSDHSVEMCNDCHERFLVCSRSY